MRNERIIDCAAEGIAFSTLVGMARDRGELDIEFETLDLGESTYATIGSYLVVVRNFSEDEADRRIRERIDQKIDGGVVMFNTRGAQAAYATLSQRLSECREEFYIESVSAGFGDPFE